MSTPNMPKDAGGVSGEDLESIRRASGVMPQDGIVCKMLRHIDHLTAELARVEGELEELERMHVHLVHEVEKMRAESDKWHNAYLWLKKETTN